MFLGYRTISRRVCILFFSLSLVYHLILFRVIEAKSRSVMASKKMELNGKIITHRSVAMYGLPQSLIIYCSGPLK